MKTVEQIIESAKQFFERRESNGKICYGGTPLTTCILCKKMEWENNFFLPSQESVNANLEKIKKTGYFSKDKNRLVCNECIEDLNIFVEED